MQKVLLSLESIIDIILLGHLLQNRTELVESVYLLTATLSHLLLYLPNSLPIGYFERPNRAICNKFKMTFENNNLINNRWQKH